MNPLQSNKFNWRKVILIAGPLAAVSFCAAAVPIVRHALSEREAERIEALYASGLHRCRGYPDDIDAFIQTFLPAKPAISITALPSFSKARAIRIVGEDLYYFELAFPLYKESEAIEPTLNREAPKISKSRLSAKTAHELVTLLAGDIRHARASFPDAIDGTSYIFEAGQGCGLSSSPPSGSRAGKITDLFDELAKQAELSSAEAAKNGDTAIYAAAKVLQDDVGGG